LQLLFSTTWVMLVSATNEFWVLKKQEAD